MGDIVLDVVNRASIIGRGKIQNIFGYGKICGKATILVLDVQLIEGVIVDNAILRLSDGKLLKVVGLERWHEKVIEARAPEAVAVIVEGIGWRPREETLIRYKGQIVKIFKSMFPSVFHT